MDSGRENETKAELKLSELSKRYGPLHPKLIAAVSDLDAARDAVLTQMKRIASGIEKEFNSAKRKERSLDRSMKEKIGDVRDINKVEFTLNGYVREVNANRTLYETFFNRIRETTETGDLQTANARVTDPAVVPKIPIKPKKPREFVVSYRESLITNEFACLPTVLVRILTCPRWSAAAR